jgi:uncharacterized membrane protein
MTRSAVFRRIVLALHGLLIATLVLAAGVTGMVLALPLLLPLPGLWRARPYTYAWGSMLVLFYAGGALSEVVMAEQIPRMALAIAVIATFEFCALLLYVRLRSAEFRATTAG